MGQHFVDVMKKARHEKGWTQYRLAKECGMSREMIGKLELEMHSPMISTVERICSALGIEIVFKRKKKRKEARHERRHEPT